MTGIQLNPTLITREPVAGELRPHTNESGVETVQVFDGKQWRDFAQPTYEALLAENARLREEILQWEKSSARVRQETIEQITVVSTGHEVVAVTLTDEEHRVLEVVWEKP